MDSWKSVLEQAKDNSRHLFNLNVNAAKTFEQNSREVRARQQLKMLTQIIMLKLQSLTHHNTTIKQ